MKLIEEIIELLSSKESQLATALFKTKVLLHKLGEKELLDWVNGELNGYKDDDSIPKYRILNVTIRGNISNGGYRYQGQNLPTIHLDEKLKDKLNTSKLTQSIAVVEEYTQQENIQIVIAPEFYNALSKGLGNGYQVENAWGQLSAGVMTQVVTEVTSRLLDFVLDLSESFPDELEVQELKDKAKEVGVSDLFNNAVFGDNVTIVVGDANKQEITNSVIKNDLDTLKSFLITNGVLEEDTVSLVAAIQNDEGSNEHAQKAFGKNVSSWIGGMVSKAASTAWDIKVGAAGSLLATALGKFYGF